MMPDFESAPVRPALLRMNFAAPLQADLFEGDTLTIGSRVVLHPGAAVSARNHISQSRAVMAGKMGDIPDVGLGGRSDAPGNAGVYGFSKNGTGVHCVSESHEALHAETSSSQTAAIAAYQMNAESHSAAFYAKHLGNGPAGVFEGDVIVSGDIILGNADFAEDFDIAPGEVAEPGTVMVLGDDGALRVSKDAYDRRVVGVVSGAGSYKPGIILDKQPKGEELRLPIGLLGKVFCKVDADLGAIQPGDLLCTSSTPGHAMLADDSSRAFGAVIGKAMGGLASGKGLLPVLVILM